MPEFQWAWRAMAIGLLCQTVQPTAAQVANPPEPTRALSSYPFSAAGQTGSTAFSNSSFSELGFESRPNAKLVVHGEPPIEAAVDVINDVVGAPAEPTPVEVAPLEPLAETTVDGVDGFEAPSYEEAIKETPAADYGSQEMKSSPKSTPSKSAMHCNCDAEAAGKAAAEKKAALAKSIAGSHKPLHYLNDFSYLNNPAYDSWHLGDSFKQLCVGGTKWDFGGQYRARIHNEYNHRGLGITGRSDDFTLHRTRLYANGQITPRLRLFGELLDANSTGENFAPRPIEENRWDIQNAFVDYKFIDNGNSSWNARAGRQEIALGDQRYVSPLDWANTRRTFDGFRVTGNNADWTIDGLYLNPMQRNNAFRTKVDRRNTDARLYGVYASNKTWTKGVLDMYWLAFDNDAAGFAYDSVGARYKGASPFGNFLIDLEGAFQFGEGPAADHDAGFFTVGAGKKFDNLPFQGTHWLYLDWASGAANGDGHHHYQPLAHKYLGFMDLFGRRNIIDLNWFSVRPLGKNLSFITWAHAFWRQNDQDAQTYAVTMGALPGQPDGSLGKFLGFEFDFAVKQKISPRANMFYGYSYFDVGETYAAAGAPDASFFYTQFTLNF